MVWVWVMVMEYGRPGNGCHQHQHRHKHNPDFDGPGDDGPETYCNPGRSMTREAVNPEDDAMLESLLEAGAITRLDAQFARLMAEISGEDAAPGLVLASALTSRATRTGNVCLEPQRAEEVLFPEGRPAGVPALPPPDEWLQEIGRARVVGAPGDRTPLVMDEAGRLYLHRYWSYQDALSRWILDRTSRVDRASDMGAVRESLSRLFSPFGAHSPGPDWQKVAACAALLRRFTVISGGPGTGKTTTAARILALILERQAGRPLRIALAAPTGKAAARLGEAVRAAREALPCEESVKSGLPDEAATLHRLLGTMRGSPEFRHHAGNPLPVDVLVVDEASMVDLALMAKLVQALHREARLILLGDRDQLASVEAGAVLGDICGPGREPSFSPSFHALLEEGTGEKLPRAKGAGAGPVRDGIVLLRRSHRFGEKSGLGRVSRLVNEGNGEGVISSLQDRDDVRWRNLPRMTSLGQALRDRVLDSFAGALKEHDPSRALGRLDEFKILCALREGPFGATAVNLLVERCLVESGLIPAEGRWYGGRPVMISRNDYGIRLFNGDMGIVLPSPEENGELRACFPMADGSVRSIHPMRLPEHETAFAVTVHKSQGSEFDRVLLILPDRPSPVLTRELLYTAVTRARRSVEIWGPEGVIREAVARRTRRFSGLEDALWSA